MFFQKSFCVNIVPLCTKSGPPEGGAVGGKENVKDVGYCATRLRFEVLDNAKVDEKAVKAAGAAGVIRPSKNACQVIIGTKVQFVYDELKKML